MDHFGGRLAVVTGGGTGMGRELVVQLAAEGCSVATCDVDADTMAETAARAEADAPAGTRVTTHRCDVSDPAQMDAFRDEVMAAHDTDHVHLVFNNAGIGGGGSFVTADRAEWERTFGVCWGGVYNGTRSFLPLLIAADEGVLVNTSSVNGFWASLGIGVPHTAYSAAKFAVRGFTEALIEDLRINAPHVSVAVVMPGHIGTDIILNSQKAHGATVDETMAEMMQMVGQLFRDKAPVTAAQAATAILDAVRAGRWRILIGDDAVAIDAAVRAEPEKAYGPDGPRLASILGGQGVGPSAG
ncbi:MAG TPA: SDR family NAD(P)-dependent oxidoreductase [Acidimicrobiales bacterium]|nr:SDR family NAD(P)-dependent oxidoreductase [Acidimicrobiales bacterium]